MPNPQVEEEQLFFEKRAKAIADRIKSNPELVAAIKKSRRRPLSDALPLSEFREELERNNS